MQIPLPGEAEPAYAQVILRIVYALSAAVLGSGVAGYVLGHGDEFRFALSWLKLVQLLYIFCQLCVFLPLVPGVSSNVCLDDGYAVISRLRIGLGYFALHGGSLLSRPPAGARSFCTSLLDDMVGYDFVSTMINMLSFLLVYSAAWAFGTLLRRSTHLVEKCFSATSRKAKLHRKLHRGSSLVLWLRQQRSDYFVGVLLLLDASLPGLALSFGRLVSTGSANCVMYGALSMIPPTSYAPAVTACRPVVLL